MRRWWRVKRFSGGSAPPLCVRRPFEVLVDARIEADREGNDDDDDDDDDYGDTLLSCSRGPSTRQVEYCTVYTQKYTIFQWYEYKEEKRRESKQEGRETPPSSKVVSQQSSGALSSFLHF